ncbi:hypothetical protein ACB094_11G029700 [Castanea mollissima]
MIQALLALQLLAEVKNIYGCGWIMTVMNPKHIFKQKYILLKLLGKKKSNQLKKDDCHGAQKYCSYPFKKIYLFFFQA